MRLVLCIGITLAVGLSTGLAADYIRLDHDVGYENQTEDLEFVVLRECPTPEMIVGASNAFVMTGINDATWTFNSFTADPTAASWFALGGLLFTNGFDDVSPDTFLTGGASMPPWGFPVVTEEQLYFTLNFTWGDLPDGGSGQVCFDSAYAWTTSTWKWSGLTCGLGGAPDRPLFLCGSAGEDVHPCCFPIVEPECGNPVINVTPPGDELSGPHTSSLGFTFGADPGTYGSGPSTIAGWSVVSGIGTIDIDGNYSVDAQSPGTYPVTIEVSNACGGSDTYSFNLVFTFEEAHFVVQIEKLEDVYQGCNATVGINMTEGTGYFAGFDFLIAYDPSALTFMDATLGSFLQGCWEYFTYRYNWMGNCGGSCGSGNLRVVAIADMNNGPYHPDPYCLHHPGPPGTPVELVALRFYVTSDHTFECMYIPIRFEWFDCGDNSVSNAMGDTLYISDHVYTYELTDVTGEPHYGGHWWIGDCQNPDPGKPSPVPAIDFIHGGIDIVCADSIDLRGDLNLNSIPNEIADAVLYTNYFIYGVGVFDINVHGQIAASDVNNDGRVLTVGDLVYLVRIVTGDALPFPKLRPFASSVEITSGNVVSVNSPIDLGAALLVFEVEGEVEVDLLVEAMKVRSDVVDGKLRVLLWSSTKDHIPAGSSELFALEGEATLVEASISDYYGNLTTIDIAEKTIPCGFALEQNYPNPFNATTDIKITLPEPSQYRLDVYNVAGQLVESISGYGVDEVTVTWDASDAASGIYLYRLTAGRYSDTKKMVLMK